MELTLSLPPYRTVLRVNNREWLFLKKIIVLVMITLFGAEPYDVLEP